MTPLDQRGTLRRMVPGLPGSAFQLQS